MRSIFRQRNLHSRVGFSHHRQKSFSNSRISIYTIDFSEIESLLNIQSEQWSK